MNLSPCPCSFILCLEITLFMKRSYLYGIGAVALIATVPLLSNTPVLAGLQQAGSAIVQAIRGPEVKLQLSADKKIVTKDTEGKDKITWESLSGKAVVMPGDVIRYTVNSKNIGDQSAKKLVVVQPIPAKTVYVLGSAQNSNGAEMTYSIDGGKTFVANPTIKVTLPDGKVEERPAPAELYTHVKWNFPKDLDPTAGVNASYEIQVP